jgi:hypothetical protein
MTEIVSKLPLFFFYSHLLHIKTLVPLMEEARLKMVAASMDPPLTLPPYSLDTVEAYQQQCNTVFCSDLKFWLTRISRQVSPTEFVGLFQDAGASVEEEAARCEEDSTRALLQTSCTWGDDHLPNDYFFEPSVSLVHYITRCLLVDATPANCAALHAACHAACRHLTAVTRQHSRPSRGGSPLDEGIMGRGLLRCRGTDPAHAVIIVSKTYAGAVYLPVRVGFAYIYILVGSFTEAMENQGLEVDVDGLRGLM